MIWPVYQEMDHFIYSHHTIHLSDRAELAKINYKSLKNESLKKS